MRTRKRQTAVKGRFSAILISAAVHVAVLIAAGAFVAVTVVQRQEARFEGRQVSRPRMQLQRLQVPQRARMERQAPQMSQRVTAQAVSTRSVDFEMPEIAGLGGGIRVDMSGAGFAGSLGFATPQINLFGLRSQGEKVVFLLDTSRWMMVDEIGGIPAYEIIKDELVGMLSRLPPTTLFNVVVFTHDNEKILARAFSEELLVATTENVERVKEWLRPLNALKTKIGFETLASPGVELEFEPLFPIANTQYGWLAGLSYALRKGSDSVYWLGANDDVSWIHRDLYQEARRGRPVDPPCGQPEGTTGFDFSTYPGGRERWLQLVEQARKMHEAENARRRAAGQPDRVLSHGGGVWILVRTYLPGVPTPEIRERDAAYRYTAQDVIDYIEAMVRKYSRSDRKSAATGRRGRESFTFNVIHFVPLGQPPQRLDRLADVPRRMNGQYVQIQGLDAVRSAATRASSNTN